MSLLDFVKQLAFWGPGAIIAAVIIWAGYKLADKFIGKFVDGIMEIGRSFVEAQKDQAASLAKMAQGAEGLRDAINSFVNRDNQEHREMIILLKYTREQIGQMTESIEAIAKHFPEIEK